MPTMPFLLFVLLIVFANLVAMLFQMVLDKRLISNTPQMQGCKILRIKRDWFDGRQIVSLDRGYGVEYQAVNGNVSRRICRVWGLVVAKKVVWIDPLADFRLCSP